MLTPRARELMLAHVVDLTALLKRLDPKTDSYKRVKARLEEAKRNAQD